MEQISIFKPQLFVFLKSTKILCLNNGHSPYNEIPIKFYLILSKPEDNSEGKSYDSTKSLSPAIQIANASSNLDFYYDRHRLGTRKSGPGESI